MARALFELCHNPHWQDFVQKKQLVCCASIPTFVANPILDILVGPDVCTIVYSYMFDEPPSHEHKASDLEFRQFVSFFRQPSAYYKSMFNEWLEYLWGILSSLGHSWIMQRETRHGLVVHMLFGSRAGSAENASDVVGLLLHHSDNDAMMG